MANKNQMWENCTETHFRVQKFHFFYFTNLYLRVDSKIREMDILKLNLSVFNSIPNSLPTRKKVAEL